MCKLFGLDLLYKNHTACYESGYFSTTDLPYSDLILEAIKVLNRQFRPAAVNTMEAIAVDDMYLQSAIGNSYGDIYETHLEWAKNSQLNNTKLGDAIPDGYMEYMMPVLKGKMWVYLLLRKTI